LLLGTLAFTTGPVEATPSLTLTVDGNDYQPSKVSGSAYHFETPDTNPSAASTSGIRTQTWTGNGSDNLPCEGGIHWISNANVLTVSHCLGEEAPEPAKLRLTFLQPCEPAEGTPELAEWRIRNTNDDDVEYEITLGGAGASIPLSGTVPPGDTIFTTPWGARTIKLETNPGDGSDTKAGGDSYNGQDCPVEPEVVKPKYKYTPPTCDAPGSVDFPQDQDGYEWVENEDGTYTAVPDEGFVLPEGFEATVGPFALDQLTGEQCETTTTTKTTQPPPSQTEVAAAGPVPPAAGPVPPAAASAPAAAAPAAVPTQLPSTGSSSWGLALTALASVLGGLGLVKLSRRTS